jgi:Flp pilus assembly protein TadD
MKWSIMAAVLTAAALLAPAGAEAQATAKAEGYVLTPEGEPIPNVRILLDYKGHQPQKYRTKTDKNGYYVHVNVWDGIYDITFTKEGEEQGVTVNDFRVTDIVTPEKPPVFRLGSRPSNEPPPPAEEEATESTPEGPTQEQRAAALAGQLDQGNAALADGDVDGAIAAYEEVLAQVPDLPEVHHNLGLAYKRKEDYERAGEEFRKAAELDPDFAEPHGALAVLLANAGHRDEAIVEAEQAVELDPENVEYLYNLAVLYKDSGKPREAEEAFLTLEEMVPDNPEIQYHMGTTLLGLGRMDEAVARLEKYVEMAPADAPNVGPAQGMLEALKKQQ